MSDFDRLRTTRDACVLRLTVCILLGTLVWHLGGTYFVLGISAMLAGIFDASPREEAGRVAATAATGFFKVLLYMFIVFMFSKQLVNLSLMLPDLRRFSAIAAEESETQDELQAVLDAD